MISKARVNKALESAKKKIAMLKLKAQGLEVFYNSDNQKSVMKTYLIDNAGLTEAQKADRDELDKFCEDCGIVFYAILLHKEPNPWGPE